MKKKTIIHSVCCIFAALLILASVTACDPSTEAPSDGFPSFDMPEALQGTWYIHPEDEAEYPDFVQKMTITEDDIIWYYKGEAVSLKETWSPSSTTQYPYLDYEFFEERSEYWYKFGMTMTNTKDDPEFVTSSWYAFEVNPRMPSMMIMYCVSYNDEYGWTDGSFIVRYMLEGTTPPDIY